MISEQLKRKCERYALVYSRKTYRLTSKIERYKAIQKAYEEEREKHRQTIGYNAKEQQLYNYFDTLARNRKSEINALQRELSRTSNISALCRCLKKIATKSKGN